MQGQLNSGDSELLDLCARQVLAAVRAGNLSAERYAGVLLRQLKVCASLNIATYIAEEHVLQAAREVDQASRQGRPLGRLAGLPILVKDNVATVGFPTSAGTLGLKGCYPPCNAPLVQRLFDQDAFLLAKTNMHELASGGTSSNAVFGSVRNPYEPRCVAGGSSGGTAAAVAARAGVLGLGTDTAGSVRIPCSFCGVVGLRPSFPAVASAYGAEGVVPLARTLDTIGPIGRIVDDVIVLHEAITAQHVTSGGGLAGRRLGVARREHWSELEPEVETVATIALTMLVTAGVELIELDLKAVQQEAMALFWILITAGNQKDLGEFLSRQYPHITLDDLLAGVRSADVRYYLEKAVRTRLSAAEVAAACGSRRAALRSEYVRLFHTRRLDAIVFPTEPVVAPAIRPGGDKFDDTLLIGGHPVSAAVAFIRQTAPACVLGAPGLTLPAGVGPSGLPVGLELDGQPGADTELLALGQAVESVLGRLPAPQFLSMRNEPDRIP